MTEATAHLVLECSNCGVKPDRALPRCHVCDCLLFQVRRGCGRCHRSSAGPDCALCLNVMGGDRLAGGVSAQLVQAIREAVLERDDAYALELAQMFPCLEERIAEQGLRNEFDACVRRCNALSDVRIALNESPSPWRELGDFWPGELSGTKLASGQFIGGLQLERALAWLAQCKRLCDQAVQALKDWQAHVVPEERASRYPHEAILAYSEILRSAPVGFEHDVEAARLIRAAEDWLSAWNSLDAEIEKEIGRASCRERV